MSKAGAVLIIILSLIEYFAAGRFVTNLQGGTKLLDGYNHQYFKEYSSARKNRTTWRCVRKTCPVRVHTQTDCPMIIAMRGMHNHLVMDRANASPEKHNLPTADDIEYIYYDQP